jgi:hypothetical protein
MAFTPVFANMVRAFTMSAGAGPITPGMAVEGHRSFAEALSAGDQFYYSIEGVAAPDEWEVGRGTMLADGRVARDPIASSSGGGPVDFSPGAKTIALTVASEWFEAPTVGRLAIGQAAADGGTAAAVKVAPSAAGGAERSLGIDVDLAGEAGQAVRKDVGIEVRTGGNGAAASMLNLRKTQESGGDFLRCFEIVPGSGERIVSTRIGSGAQIETRKWMCISGTVDLGSVPDAGDPRHEPRFVYPSAQPFMFGVLADVVCCAQLRPPATDTLDNYLLSALDRLGRERLTIEQDGDLGFPNGRTPDAGNFAGRRGALAFRFGRRGPLAIGPKGAALGLERYSEAQLATAAAPDAYVEGPGAAIWVDDAAPGAGVYVSDGERWVRQGGPVEVDTGWGEPIASQDIGAAVSAATFTGLAGYGALRLEAWGLSHDAGSARLPVIQLSADNGASWRTAGYENGGSAETGGISLCAGGIEAGAALSFTAEICDFANAARRTRAAAQFARVGDMSAGSFGAMLGRYGGAEAHDALRLALNGSGAFDAGELRLYGRRPRFVGGERIGPDSFGWTPQQFMVAGSGAAVTETARRTFERTAGPNDWTASVLSVETIAGDQLVEFILQSPARQLMVGLATAAPSVAPGAPMHWLGLRYAVYQAGTAIFGVVDGSIGGLLAGSLGVGRRIGIRKTGAVVTVEVDRARVATLSEAAANLPYRLMITLNDNGAKAGELRRRGL